MRFFDIKLSFGLKSTASKILYQVCDMVGDHKKNKQLSEGFSVNNYNDEIRNFTQVRDMLAKVLESEMDYKFYCESTEDIRLQTKKYLALALFANRLTRPVITSSIDEASCTVNYNPAEFSNEISEEDIFVALTPAFDDIQRLNKKGFCTSRNHSHTKTF